MTPLACPPRQCIPSNPTNPSNSHLPCDGLLKPRFHFIFQIIEHEFASCRYMCPLRGLMLSKTWQLYWGGRVADLQDLARELGF